VTVGQLELVDVEGRTLAELADIANREHDLAYAAANDAVKHAINCGRALLEAKGQLQHGDWLPWLEANFVGSIRKAQVWTQLAANAQHAAHLPSIRAGLRALAAGPGANGDRERDQQAREITPHPERAVVDGDGWRLIGGDCRDVLAEIPVGTVDLIVTDPPYPAEFLPLWADLSELAARVLKPQAILCVLTGKLAFPDRLAALGSSLAYGWVYDQPLHGSSSRILARHVCQEWKPWLAYSNGPWPSGRVDWHPDRLEVGSRSKSRYRWEQDGEPAACLIDELSAPGDVVLDPFCGVGTYGTVAVRMGRQFVGVEWDAGRFDQAVARLRGLS